MLCGYAHSRVAMMAFRSSLILPNVMGLKHDTLVVSAPITSSNRSIQARSRSHFINIVEGIADALNHARRTESHR